jgi:hypothetical protein
MRLLVLITAMAVAFVSNALADDDLTRRLRPLAGLESHMLAVVYDEYPSGRPRRVVATFGNSVQGTLLLVLFPNSVRGKPRLLDRQELAAGPGDVRLEHLIDAKDVVVSMIVRHSTTSIVLRVIGDRLVQIADDFGEAIDLDGDGVPEIITQSYAGQNQCGVYLFVDLARWSGKRYVSDRRRYITALSRGEGMNSSEVLLSASKHYVVRIFGPGRVTLDDEDVEPGKPFTTEEDCHILALRDSGARTRAFLEERP